jgi:hypothetical protein
MKLHRILIMILIICSIFSSGSIVRAGDFDWLKNLSIQAQADPSGFNATLATRFKIGDIEVNAVISDVTDPADAYMVLRLGEMASKPTGYVIEQYKAGKNQGWGVLAKSLGIKPGSEEFKALKLGHDLQGGKVKNKKGDNSKSNSEGKRQGKK